MFALLFSRIYLKFTYNCLIKLVLRLLYINLPKLLDQTSIMTFIYESSNVDLYEEEGTIGYCYCCGFEYNEIIALLEKRYAHGISKSTLLRRLSTYELLRHNQHINFAVHQQ